MKAKVLLLQDLALEGWKSMDIYAEQLKSRLPLAGSRYDIVAPDDYVLKKQRATGLIERLYARYVSYPALLRRYESDIIHILDHSYAHLLRGRDPQRVIITVHDLYTLHSSDNGGLLRGEARGALLKWVMRWCARAALLIAVSDFTRRQIIELMGYPERRIRTVPLGVDECFFAEPDEERIADLRARLRLPSKPIILHVGSCVARKNIGALFGALSRLREQGKDAHLLQVGGIFTSVQKDEIRRQDLASSITQLDYVTDDELPLIYRLADLLLFPSNYEGFGLPVLEAMASGTAIVAARAASIPELAGEAALLVEPNDWDGLTRAVLRILADNSLRSELIAGGRERAARYNWSSTAKEIISVYDELLSSSG
jgi:glycosyltransferase involved in cell wall biosynthesis